MLRHALSGCSSCSGTLRIYFSSRGYLDIPLLPFGLSSPVFETGCRPLTWEYCLPPSCGFPPKSFPLKGNPPFWGKPSALGHEGVRGRRLHGAAMLCRLQCARGAIRWRIADALPSSPRHSHGRRRLSRGGTPPVKVWLGGSTPKEITSCQTASRSNCSLNRLRMITVVPEGAACRAHFSVKPVYFCARVNYNFAERKVSRSNYGI